MDIKLELNQNPKTLHCRLLIQDGNQSRAELMRLSGASRTTVSRLLREAKDPKPKGKPGRKPKLPSSPRKKLRLMAYKSPTLSNTQLAMMMEEKKGIQVSRWTIGRTLKSMSIVRKKPRPVPDLTDIQKQRRLAWCLKHRETDWSRTVFSDESRFQFSANTMRLLCSNKKKPVALDMDTPKELWFGEEYP